jgi:hypothetical protein
MGGGPRDLVIGGLERPVALERLERQRSLTHRVTYLVLCGDLLLGLDEHFIHAFARDDDKPVVVADDPVSGRDLYPADEDRDIAVSEELPAWDAILRRDVAGKDREILPQDVLDIARAAITNGACAAARSERRDRELPEVRGGSVIGLIHGHASRRHRAEHLEDPPDRPVVVVTRMRPPEDRVDRARDPHPGSQGHELGRECLLQIAVAIEDVGERAGVQRREPACKLTGRFHRS